MPPILRYISYSIVLILLLCFYFLYTSAGQQNTYSILSYLASKKSHTKIEIKSIDLYSYPYIKAEALVENNYTVSLNGLAKKSHLDINYTITSDCIQSRVCSLYDSVNLYGKITGHSKDINITGKGKLLDGYTHYQLRKQKKTYKDVHLTLEEVNASKLFKLFGQKAIFKGKATAQLDFDYFNKHHKKGSILYDVKENNFSGFLADLHIKVDVKDEKYTFLIDVIAPDASLHITKGTYQQKQKYAHAFYTLDIKDLTTLKSLLKQNYLGSFNAFGEMEYTHKNLKIKGLSKSLGGLIDFVYNKKVLTLDYKDISLKNVMQRLSTASAFYANITGHLQYDVDKKNMRTNAILKDIQFKPSSFATTLKKKFNVDIVHEKFENSSFDATYKNHIFASKITIANKKTHIILKNTKIDSRKNSIDTSIDLRIPKHTLNGKLYLQRLNEKFTKDVYVKFDGLVEKYYHLKLDGLVSQKLLNLDYTLQANRVPSHLCTIEDTLNLKGHLSGAFEHLDIGGQGRVLDGNVSFHTLKVGSELKNLTLTMKQIHSLKLSTLLGYPVFPVGKATIHANFDSLTKEQMRGKLSYDLHHAKYKSLPLDLKSNVVFKGTKQTFSSQINLAGTHIHISKGEHNLRTKQTRAMYTIDVKNLESLKPIVSKNFHGPFYAMGKLTYHKDLAIRGLSKTFGGNIDFLYKKDMLYLDLESVSFARIMGLFSYPSILKARVNGNINYNFNKDLLLVKTHLNHAKFLPSDLVENIFQKSSINLLRETFTKSTLEGNYQKNNIFANLKLANNKSHFYLLNTQINTKQNTIHAFFDFNMQQQAFSGKIFGSLNKPTVDLNMQKLIKYQMDKQLDTYMGKQNRKLMESMPMGDVAKDMAAEMGGGFMDVFF